MAKCNELVQVVTPLSGCFTWFSRSLAHFNVVRDGEKKFHLKNIKIEWNRYWMKAGNVSNDDLTFPHMCCTRYQETLHSTCSHVWHFWTAFHSHILVTIHTKQHLSVVKTSAQFLFSFLAEFSTYICTKVERGKTKKVSYHCHLVSVDFNLHEQHYFFFSTVYNGEMQQRESRLRTFSSFQAEWKMDVCKYAEGNFSTQTFLKGP